MNEEDICRRQVAVQDLVGQACGVCGHTDFAHPGVPNPSLEECAICRLLFVADQHMRLL